jgi:hypothetical protein
MTHVISLPARLPGFRLLWCPLALSIAALTLIEAWLIRPRGLAYDSDAFLSSAIGVVGVLMALSALPLPSRANDP